MNICIITLEYPPMVHGGVGSATCRIAKNLAGVGLNMHVIAPGSLGIEETITPSCEDGVTVYRTFPALGNYYGDPMQLREIGRYVVKLHEKINFDLIHGMFLIPPGLVGAVVAKEIDRPLIVSIRGSDIELMRYIPMLSRTVGWVMEQASVVTSVTTDLMEKAKQIASLQKYKVISNAFDADEFDPWTIREIAVGQGWRFQLFVEKFLRAKSRERVIIGTVGIIRPVKGFPVLLEAFRKLVAFCPKAYLLIVGDFSNPEEKKVRLKQIKALGLNQHVFITGPSPHRHVLAWTREMDIFVLPSLYEGSPNALLEAMACGLPVVASRAGGIPDIATDGVDAMLIPPRDAEALAQQFITLVQNEPLRIRLGEAAKQTVQARFSPADETDAWMQVYRSVGVVNDRVYGAIPGSP